MAFPSSSISTNNFFGLPNWRVHLQAHAFDKILTTDNQLEFFTVNQIVKALMKGIAHLA